MWFELTVMVQELNFQTCGFIDGKGRENGYFSSRTIFITSRDLIFKNNDAQSLPSIGKNLNKLILEVMKQI